MNDKEWCQKNAQKNGNFEKMRLEVRTALDKVENNKGEVHLTFALTKEDENYWREQGLHLKQLRENYDSDDRFTIGWWYSYEFK